MAKILPARIRLAQYFSFDTMIKRPVWAWTLTLLQAAAVFWTFLWVMKNHASGRPDITGYLAIEALFASIIVYTSSSLLKFSVLQLHKLVARTLRGHRLKSLERDVKQLLQTDYKRAIRTMVKQSGLKPADLRGIGSTYHDPLESRLFDDTELRSFLGLMADQSIRMSTPYGPSPDFAAQANDRLNGQGMFEGYFLPVRLICLFFTESRVVVGSSIFDSRSGDHQTQVYGVPLTYFRGLNTQTRTTKEAVDTKRLLAWLAEHRFTPQQEKKIGELIETYLMEQERRAHRDQSPLASPYLLQRQSKQLILGKDESTRKALPMRMDYQLIPGSLKTYKSGFMGLGDNYREVLLKVPPLPSKREGPSTGLLEYRTGNSLVSELITACFLTSICFSLMHIMTTDSTKRFTSTSMSDVFEERSGEVTPRLQEWQHLSADLKQKVRSDPQGRFACTNQWTDVRARPDYASSKLARMAPGYPVIVSGEPDSTMPSSPSGWQHVELDFEAKRVVGFVAGTSLAYKPVNSPLDCPG